VVIPGLFDTGVNYKGMVTGNKCRGSGYFEVLIEAKVVTTGCLSGMLKGKTYPKALLCLKTVSEAMQRLMLRKRLLLLIVVDGIIKCIIVCHTM